MTESVFLVGPMGAGKTTIGKSLARSLGMAFVDSDKAIVEQIGMPIADYFAAEGEKAFREVESQVIDRLTRLPRIVLATGGGAVLAARNRAYLITRGIVVYLYCSVEEQFARTSRGQHRPLLRTGDPLQTLASLMAERDPLYREIAELTVDAGTGKVNEITTKLVQELGYARKGEDLDL